MATIEWQFAELRDVPSIVELAQQHFQSEIDQVFTPNPRRFAQHVSAAIVEQSFDPLRQQLIIARDQVGLAAYTWVTRGHYMTYADEEIAEVLFAHTRMTLSARLRIQLIRDMIQQWQLWSLCAGIKVLVSSTIRSDQSAFLRLHEQAGFIIRGSMAFKKIYNEINQGEKR